LVDIVNGLEPDIIVFTGDMVNNHASEAEGWEDVFGGLKAKMGKYSIFGNHDYAHYGPYDETQREDSIARLKEVHRKMGFQLMEDEHVHLERDSERIALLGVHNWGKGFGEIGDLEKAYEGLNDDGFKVLLSHDPTHFEEQVLGKKSIDLTLSGHTHGMQMGIEIPALGLKWSPVSLRYKRWAGLYEEAGQFLNVNRGMGVIAYPGRVGMPPEITCIDLRSEQTA
jgi:predicted MPP superfamily phosphohydrolase